jgi:hypothetical protein
MMEAIDTGQCFNPTTPHRLFLLQFWSPDQGLNSRWFRRPVFANTSKIKHLKFPIFEKICKNLHHLYMVGYETNWLLPVKK